MASTHAAASVISIGYVAPIIVSQRHAKRLQDATSYWHGNGSHIISLYPLHTLVVFTCTCILTSNTHQRYWDQNRSSECGRCNSNSSNSQMLCPQGCNPTLAGTSSLHTKLQGAQEPMKVGCCSNCLCAAQIFCRSFIAYHSSSSSCTLRITIDMIRLPWPQATAVWAELAIFCWYELERAAD
jgi:hypothetical protein